MSVEDVEVESLIPDDIFNREYTGSKEKCMKPFLKFEGTGCAQLEHYQAAAEGKQLRYKFT